MRLFRFKLNFNSLQVSTTENLAVLIWDSLRTFLPRPELLFEVKIFETEKNIVRFRGHDAILGKNNGVSNVQSREVYVSSDSDS